MSKNSRLSRLSDIRPSQYSQAGKSLSNASLAQFASGSKGKLGEVLEKLHSGMVLSQHEVSAALREYNQLTVKIAELEHRTQHMRLQVGPNEALPELAEKNDKSLGRSQRDKYIEQLNRKERVISELNEKLKKLNHVARSKATYNIHVADIAPPTKLVDSFVDVYEHQWALAFETLKRSWKDEDKAIYTLFRIVRHAYVFCLDVAQTQRTAVEEKKGQLQDVMVHPVFVHAVSGLKYKPSVATTSEMQRHLDVGNKLIQDYRNTLVTQSIAGVQELFNKVKLPEILDSSFVVTAVQSFIDRVVALLWLMVVQDPPMHVYWIEPRSTTMKEYFKYYDKHGVFVKQTVWPAVFLKDDGAIMSKGVVMAVNNQDECEVRF